MSKEEMPIVIATMISEKDKIVGIDGDGIIALMKDKFKKENTDREIVIVNLNDINIEYREEDNLEIRRMIDGGLFDAVAFTLNGYDALEKVGVFDIEGLSDRGIPQFYNIFEDDSIEKSVIISTRLADRDIKHYSIRASDISQILAIPNSVTVSALKREQKVIESENLLEYIEENVINKFRKKDEYTAEHLIAVSEIAVEIAKALGKEVIPEEDIDIVRKGGLFHDIGKLWTSNYVLNKPERLNDKEFAHIEQHVPLGEAEMARIHIGKKYERVKSIVSQHQEKYDGTGYPSRLEGKDTDIIARIIQVADGVHAMCGRHYQDPKSNEEIIKELNKNSNYENIDKIDENGRLIGCQFDRNIALACINIIEKGTLNLQKYRDENKKLFEKQRKEEEAKLSGTKKDTDAGVR